MRQVPNEEHSEPEHSSGPNESQGVTNEESCSPRELVSKQSIVINCLDSIDEKRSKKVNDEREEKKKSKLLTSARFYMMLLALTSPFTVTFSKQQINVSILDMVDPSLLQNRTTTKHNTRTESCPVDEIITENSNNDDDTRIVSINRGGHKYMWDAQIQGFIKSSYSIGHLPLQILGSRLAETHGSHKVMSISALCMFISNLAAPFLADLHYSLLMADIAILGLLGGFMTPALVNLFSNWLTPQEKSLFMTLYLVASRLGSALGTYLSFLLIRNASWEYVFYSAALISLLFTLSFYILASNRPSECKLMSEAELQFLASKNRLVRESLEQKNKSIELKAINSKQQAKDSSKRTKKKAPLIAVLTNRSVWAFILTKYFVKSCGELAEKETPNYLKHIMHLSDETNGIISSSNYVIFSVGCLMAGISSNYLIKKRPLNMSKSTIRKLMQSISSFGSSLGLIGIALYACDIVGTAISFALLFALTTYGAGGEAQMPLDLSERYSGTIHALGSSIASTSGIFVPIVVGRITKDHGFSMQTWKVIWLGASGFSFLGGLIFVLFGDANIQPFDSIGIDEKDQDIEAQEKAIRTEEKLKEDKSDETSKSNKDIGEEKNSKL